MDQVKIVTNVRPRRLKPKVALALALLVDAAAAVAKGPPPFTGRGALPEERVRSSDFLFADAAVLAGAAGMMRVRMQQLQRPLLEAISAQHQYTLLHLSQLATTTPRSTHGGGGAESETHRPFNPVTLRWPAMTDSLHTVVPLERVTHFQARSLLHPLRKCDSLPSHSDLTRCGSQR